MNRLLQVYKFTIYVDNIIAVNIVESLCFKLIIVFLIRIINRISSISKNNNTCNLRIVNPYAFI